MNLKVIIAAAIAATVVATASATLPTAAGWYMHTSAANKYETWSDSTVTMSGKPSVGLKSKANVSGEFATSMQAMAADQYSGKRVRLSGFIKSENVTGWSGIWFRVDGADKKILGFDNMHSRGIKGTTDWSRYDVVLDVPADAANLAFGLILTGAGKVWVDKLAMEAVPLDVPTTNMRNLQSDAKPVDIELR